MTVSRRMWWIGGGVLVAAVAAAGVWFFLTHPLTPPAPADSQTEIGQPTVIVYGPAVPMQWSWTEIPWHLTRFTVPEGHWVYFSRWNREFLVIPGEPLYEGAPEPNEEELYKKAVIIFNDAYFEKESFVSWDRFMLTLAEFGCARGTSEADYVLCDDEPVRRSSGTTPVGAYTSFALPKRSYATQESLGVAPFIMVQLGVKEQRYGILIYAVDASKEAMALQFAKSLKRTSNVDE
jgi:hypothetical protein